MMLMIAMMMMMMMMVVVVVMMVMVMVIVMVKVVIIIMMWTIIIVLHARETANDQKPERKIKNKKNLGFPTIDPVHLTATFLLTALNCTCQIGSCSS